MRTYTRARGGYARACVCEHQQEWEVKHQRRCVPEPTIPTASMSFSTMLIVLLLAPQQCSPIKAMLQIDYALNPTGCAVKAAPCFGGRRGFFLYDFCAMSNRSWMVKDRTV